MMSSALRVYRLQETTNTENNNNSAFFISTHIFGLQRANIAQKVRYWSMLILKNGKIVEITAKKMIFSIKRTPFEDNFLTLQFK